MAAISLCRYSKKMGFLRTFILTLGLFTFFSLSQCSHTRNATSSYTISTEKHVTFLPEPNPVIHRQGYVLSYDCKTRNANWVYEELTASSLNGNIDRMQCDFMEDPLIPPSLRSTKEDYRGSGFDRGHLRPAANARASQEAMQETFYLSNISPQHPLLNRKYWVKLEKYVRELTKSYDVVYVITGPLFLPRLEKDGKRYVKYEVIGKNNVAVPTHYFKVLQEKKGSIFRTEAFIIPNETISEDYPLQQFAVTLDKVERAAGVIFKRF